MSLTPTQLRRAWWGLVLAAMVAAMLWGLAYPARPVSDFALYWESGADLRLFLKGGVYILALSLFHAAGAGPVTAAITLNLLAILAFAVSVPPSVFQRRDWSSLALLFSYAALIWYAVILAATLEVTVAAAALACLGARILMSRAGGAVPRAALAVLLWGAALSVREQLIIAVAVALGLAGVTAGVVWAREGFARLRILVRGLGLGAAALLVALAITLGLRAVSTQQAAMKEADLVQFHLGLWGDRARQTCGLWYPAPRAEFEADLTRPRITVMMERLGRFTLGDAFHMVTCKIYKFFIAPLRHDWVWRIGRADEQARDVRVITAAMGRVDWALVWVWRIALGLILWRAMTADRPALAEGREGLAVSVRLLVGIVVVVVLMPQNDRYLIQNFGALTATLSLMWWPVGRA